MKGGDTPSFGYLILPLVLARKYRPKSFKELIGQSQYSENWDLHFVIIQLSFWLFYFPGTLRRVSGKGTFKQA